MGTVDGDALLSTAADVLGLADVRYTFDEAVARAGVRPDLARRYWRALGFADPVGEETMLGDRDVEALRLATRFVAGPDSEEQSVAQARAICAALARVADTWCDTLRRLHAAGMTWDEVAEFVPHEFEGGRIATLLDYVHSRLLLASLRREVEAERAGTAGKEVAVGFVDLVGWTELTRSLEPAELGRLVMAFEGTAYDAVVDGGGRFVKLIGDEVMFTAPTVEDAVAICAGLLHDRAGLPPCRAGVAGGHVVRHEGDVFGPPVNLASRIVELADPGSVVVDRPVAGAAVIGIRAVKGIGDVELWSVAAS
jgi:adenylate cyclase